MKRFWTQRKKYVWIDILAGFVLLLGVLIPFVPTVPDEYLYVTLGKNVAAAFQRSIDLSSLDTRHTPLIPFLYAVMYLITRSSDIHLYRILTIPFAIGVILVTTKIAATVFPEKKLSPYFPFLFLLFPGFFLYSARALLDIPVLFFVMLTLYATVLKRPSWQIGLSAAAVFATKEYIFFLLLPALVCIGVIDSVQQPNPPAKTAIQFFRHLCILILPSFILFSCTMIFPILPYASMVNTWGRALAGPAYYGATSFVYSHIYGNTIRPFDQVSLGTSLLTSDALRSLISNNILLKFIHSWTSTYNDTEVTMFAVPFVFMGIYEFIKKTALTRTRPLIIFSIFTIFVSYLQLSLGENPGIRFVLPIVPILIMFSYYGLLSSLKRTNPKGFYILLGIVLLSIAGYVVYFQRGYASDPILSTFTSSPVRFYVKFKVYVNAGLYILLTCILVGIFKFKKKLLIPVSVCIGLVLFAWKTAPTIYAQTMQYTLLYGHDYELAMSTPFLRLPLKENEFIASNLTDHLFNYYADATPLHNLNTPLFRPTRQIYPDHLIQFDPCMHDLSIQEICRRNIRYVFYVNTVTPTSCFSSMMPFLKQDGIFTPIKEQFYQKYNRYSWGVYQVNSRSCR